MCIVLSGRLEKSIVHDPSVPEIPIGSGTHKSPLLLDA